MKAILVAVLAGLPVIGCAASGQRGPAAGKSTADTALAWADQNAKSVSGAVSDRWFVELAAVDMPPEVNARFLRQEDRHGYGLYVTRRPIHVASAWLALRDESADTQFIGRKWCMVEGGPDEAVKVVRGEWYTPHAAEPQTPNNPEWPVARKVYEGVAVKFKAKPGKNGRVAIDGVVENHAVIRPFTEFVQGTSPASMAIVRVPEVRRHDIVFSAEVFPGEVIALLTEAWSASGEPVQRLVTLLLGSGRPAGLFDSDLPSELDK